MKPVEKMSRDTMEVVSAASGEVGTASTTWAPPERLACWEYWAP